jgi:arginine decarboxylase
MAENAADAGLNSMREHFSIADARHDRWAQLAILGRAWEAAAGRGENSDRLRDQASRLLAELAPLEEFFAYPGLRLRRALHEHVEGADAGLFANLAQRINASLSSGVYRHDSSHWEPGEESQVTVQDFLPPSPDQPEAHRPYFEVLGVTATDPSRYEQARQDIRRLRRPDDPFIYELLQVGSFEDAIIGVIANPDVQAVGIGDGFSFRSRHDLPGLREILSRTFPFDPVAADVRDYGLKVAWALRNLCTGYQ